MAQMPTVFVSHGAPTFAMQGGLAGDRLSALGRALPRAEAILVVSPHWMTARPTVGAAARPETIHDFGGFDAALYRLRYPAAGSPSWAGRAAQALRDAGWATETDDRRGLDHGAWVPLLHMFPLADVPVFQVSLPARLDADSAWALGAALQPLTREGVLVLGSGSLTHNLHEFRQAHGHDEPYVEEFAAWVRAAAESGDVNRLRRTLVEAPHARRAHPTPEHFWPLLVAAGAAPAGTPTATIEGGVTHGVLSMDGFVFGESATQHHGAAS
jgi:4,5-DOPA dioxygenase extradiol